MIGKVCPRGADVRRLLFYLFTEGLAGQHGLDSDHTDAHLIVGWDDPRLLEPPRQQDGRRDLRRLAGIGEGSVQLPEARLLRSGSTLGVSISAIRDVTRDEALRDVVLTAFARRGILGSHGAPRCEGTVL